jgi:hypothetical protein
MRVSELAEHLRGVRNQVPDFEIGRYRPGPGEQRVRLAIFGFSFASVCGSSNFQTLHRRAGR